MPHEQSVQPGVISHAEWFNPHQCLLLMLLLQAFGMMGWRLGYIAYPNAESAADPELGFQMSKVQDTIPICVTQMSQVAGLGALEAGSSWVKQQVQGLAGNRCVTAAVNSISMMACWLTWC